MDRWSVQRECVAGAGMKPAPKMKSLALLASGSVDLLLPRSGVVGVLDGLAAGIAGDGRSVFGCAL